MYTIYSKLSSLTKQNNSNSEDIIFCTEDNLKQSLNALNEEFESFGISPMTINNNDLETSKSLKKLSIRLINATWNLIYKHRSLMRLHDQLIESDHRTVNDNVNLKNHVKRLKEDLQKKEHMLFESQEKERRLKVQNETILRNLKHEKEETRKLMKQAHSKNIQHEHEVRRIMQDGQKLQEQLKKSAGTFVSKYKVSQEMQVDHEKEVALYKQTIVRLEENNRKMLEEISSLKETLQLFKTGLDLHIESSGWNVN
ncbi:afadin- and alpha-actinin-binding protein-like isoform X1 [Pseudomyrmex gracilis]|uniref:afadin- and alpha-actinin-binding protein-like isoform X1 n=2 Tax=Pseudomyrmex gracilis TaxID=219809 RepID=UPI000995DB0A|nr:afadin- and alpha-actinin-binding protein-like isoform X1 [Pseudomyrmex gracilis]XP_020292626.1 afadin- and alpha-actinin-binding protein-like isoform X1 [Pseudomyrmex gracilis]XP_020292627.1 afadin- and alpha-actinin-binding protein-like isoform X1 [Pseudomyrmex gracilis]